MTGWPRSSRQALLSTPAASLRIQEKLKLKGTQHRIATTSLKISSIQMLALCSLSLRKRLFNCRTTRQCPPKLQRKAIWKLRRRKDPHTRRVRLRLSLYLWHQDWAHLVTSKRRLNPQRSRRHRTYLSLKRSQCHQIAIMGSPSLGRLHSVLSISLRRRQRKTMSQNKTHTSTRLLQLPRHCRS